MDLIGATVTIKCEIQKKQNGRCHGSVFYFKQPVLFGLPGDMRTQEGRREARILSQESTGTETGMQRGVYGGRKGSPRVRVWRSTLLRVTLSDVVIVIMEGGPTTFDILVSLEFIQS